MSVSPGFEPRTFPTYVGTRYQAALHPDLQRRLNYNPVLSEIKRMVLDSRLFMILPTCRENGEPAWEEEVSYLLKCLHGKG